MMSFWAVRLGGDGRELLGSSDNLIVRDVKTVKGVEGRIRRSRSLSAGEWRIYSFPYEKKYERNAYKLVRQFRK